MFFRNLTMFRLPLRQMLAFQALERNEAASFSIEEPMAAEAFRANALKQVGPLELNSRGFIPPYGAADDGYTVFAEDGTASWFTVGGEDKLLPAAVVNAKLAAKLDAIEKAEGRRPGGKTRRRIKDDLLHELLPAAFVKPSRIDAMMDLRSGVLFVDTSSRKQGESVVSQVRGAFGSFPAMPVNAEVAPRSVLTGWISGEPLPAGLSLGEECVLVDPIDGGAVLKSQAQELRSEEIDKHLEAGKQCTRLALVLDDRLSFVLGDDLVIRKLRFLEGAVDSLENTEADDLRAELDARMHLQAAELARLFAVLESALKLSKVEG
jgi:recombination associated protein RdgC